jgi:hypothetical protein
VLRSRRTRYEHPERRPRYRRWPRRRGIASTPRLADSE